MPLPIARRSAVLTPRARATPTGPTYATVVSDSFNRADRTGLGTADTGQVWVDAINGFNIVSNQAGPRQSGANNITVIDAGAGANNARIQARFAAHANSNVSLMYRYVDPAHYTRVQALVSTGTISVIEVGGAGTILAVPGLTLADGDSVAIDAIGTAISVYLNGVLVGQATTALNLTATQHGLFGGATTSQRFDDFLVQKIT